LKLVDNQFSTNTQAMKLWYNILIVDAYEQILRLKNQLSEKTSLFIWKIINKKMHCWSRKKAIFFSSLINEKGGLPNYYNTYQKQNASAENETKEEKEHTFIFISFCLFVINEYKNQSYF